MTGRPGGGQLLQQLRRLQPGVVLSRLVPQPAGRRGEPGLGEHPVHAAAHGVRDPAGPLSRTPTPDQWIRAAISAFSSVRPACTSGTPWASASVTPV